MVSRFSRRRPFIKTQGVNLTEENYFNLGGLNLYTPDELMKDNETPYARNFRIFQSDDLESRVSVSKRKGHTFYTVPVGETDRGHQTSTTGAADKTVSSINWFAQKFTVSAAGRLTKVTINVKNDNVGTAPLLVDIYNESSSKPGTKIASSSISQSAIAATYGYVTVRFIEAPVVATSTNYYIVIHQQSEGTGDYKLSSTTTATNAFTSTDGGNNWTAAAYDFNFYTYVSTDAVIKGVYRYYKSTLPNDPVTLVVAGTVLYSVNDATGALTSIGTGFSADAVDYRFVTVEDIVYIVNGYDDPKTWNGTTFGTATGAVAQFTAIGSGSYKAKDVVFHKQRLWYLLTDNNITYSDDLAFDTFGSSLNFIYAPSPKHPDPAMRIIPYQDNLVVFTANGKWTIYGSDRQTITIRESTAVKGLCGVNALWKHGDYLYFVSDDDVYYYNGGTDTGLGLKVNRLFEDMATKRTVNMIIHEEMIRVYYTPSGEGFNSKCMLYDLGYKQWMQDDKIYASRAWVLNSQKDEDVLVVSSSLVSALYYPEMGNSDLGRGIEFEYRTKYFTYDHPSKKHRIKRLYPFFRPVQDNYAVDVQVDVDEANAPSSNLVYIGSDGATWGGGDTWGGGAVWGGSVLTPQRISIPGRNRKHQIRFVQYGVDNPVELLGYSVYYQVGRAI